jgi:glycosyltransferase involved in cell wall biosynthesis
VSNGTRPDVTLISPYPSPDRASTSGVAWYSQNLARALSDEGASVTVLAPGAKDSNSFDLDGNVRVRRCFARGARGIFAAAGEAVRTGAPVTHVQHEAFLYGGPHATAGVIGGLARLRAAGVGPVVTMHQVVTPSRVDASFTRLHQIAIPAPMARAGLAALQASIVRVARRLIVHEPSFSIAVPGSVVVPLAVGSPGKSVQPATPRDQRDVASILRRDHGIANEDFLVLCFGFVAPYKGIEIALAAADQAGPKVRLVVAGAEHPRLSGKRYLESLMRRYDGVAVFTGYVPDSQVGAWFSASDSVLLAYPEVFSSSGVLALAVEHQVPALLSPSLAAVVGFPTELSVPIEPGPLAERLAELALRGPDLESLADHTRRLGQDRSWPQVAKRHLEIYKEVTVANRAASLHGRA